MLPLVELHKEVIMEIGIFCFNDFMENTYILHDETGDCVIIDPGCSNAREEGILVEYIDAQGLTPKRLLNTHCHIDHVLGNHFVAERYNLSLESHKGELPVLEANKLLAQMYGMSYTESVPIDSFLDEGDAVSFGDTSLEVLFTPGHSPASISFYHRESKQLIAGDVLFQGSIGRTDLPGGDFDTLIKSIKEKYYPLGDDVTVYPGHGPSTTIIEEKLRNPFLQ